MFEEEIQRGLYDLGAFFSATQIFFWGGLNEQTSNNYNGLQCEAKKLGIEFKPLSLLSRDDFVRFRENVLVAKYTAGDLRYFDLGCQIVTCHITNHCSPSLRDKNKQINDQRLNKHLLGFYVPPEIILNIFHLLESATEEMLDTLKDSIHFYLATGVLPDTEQQKLVELAPQPQAQLIPPGESMSVTRSAVHQLFHITHNTWVVSIMRKAEEGNTEHAFLIVEGVTQFGLATVKRYDLVLHLQKAGYADIVILPKNESDNVQTVMALTKGDKYFYQSWQITRDQASFLHQNILNDKKMADSDAGIPYQISGNESLIAKSSPQSTLKNGHNCFTWAREKLRQLDDPVITDSIKSKITDCIVAKTSLYLVDPEKKSRPCLLM